MLFTVVLEVFQLLLAPEDAEQYSHAELLAHAVGGAECVPRLVPGPRRWLIGPRGGAVRVPVPEYCPAAGRQAAVIAIVATMLSTLVGLVASLDVAVEFFSGVLDDATGLLTPKPRRDRYLKPPHSLLFNIAVNPTMKFANRLATALLFSDNPHQLFRLVIWMQPVAATAESTVGRWVRRAMRKSAHWFSRAGGSRPLTAEAIALQDEMQEVTASLAAHLLSDRDIHGPGPRIRA